MEIISSDFEEGEEIPKKFGYKHENKQPCISLGSFQEEFQKYTNCSINYG